MSLPQPFVFGAIYIPFWQVSFDNMLNKKIVKYQRVFFKTELGISSSNLS